MRCQRQFDTLTSSDLHLWLKLSRAFLAFTVKKNGPGQQELP